MKLTNIIRTLCLGAALSSTALLANTVYLENTDNDGVPDARGGEFKIYSSQFGVFYTFCLEKQVGIIDGTYEYTVDSAALLQGDTLSVGSAWLYEQFFKGTLVGLTPFSNYLDDRDVNAGLLQNAFWALEDEGGTETFYYNLAVGHFGSVAAAKADIDDSSKVRVLNLWGARGEDKQSQLVYVPDSGMTAILLGLGLLSLAAFRRKL